MERMIRENTKFPCRRDISGYNSNEKLHVTIARAVITVRTFLTLEFAYLIAGRRSSHLFFMISFSNSLYQVYSCSFGILSCDLG